jgi:hypothetical protein
MKWLRGMEEKGEAKPPPRRTADSSHLLAVLDAAAAGSE